MFEMEIRCLFDIVVKSHCNLNLVYIYFFYFMLLKY